MLLVIGLGGCTGTNTGNPPEAQLPSSQRPAHTPGGGIGSEDTVRHAWKRLSTRPLHIPRDDPGQACPVTRQWTPARAARLPRYITQHPHLGRGPVFPGIYSAWGPLRRSTIVELDPFGRRWFRQKVLWIVATTYRGPVLIRGRRVDGRRRIHFPTLDDPGPVSRQLRIPPGVHDMPSYTYLTTLGCYAWQVDGLGFSQVLVVLATERRPARR